MTKTTHFGSNRNFGLSKAVLVYSDGQEAFATVHETKASPDGGAPYLDAGQALTIDFLTQLAKGAGADDSMRNSSTECPGVHAGPTGLVDQAAAASDVLRRF